MFPNLQYLVGILDKEDPSPSPAYFNTLYKYTAIITLLLLSSTCVESKPAQSAQHTSEILFLNSYSEGHPWSRRALNGLLEGLTESGKDVDLVMENMGLRDFKDEPLFEKIYNLYNYKFRNKSFDIIVSADDPAIRFLLEYHKKLFPGTPVVFCGVDTIPEEVLDEKNLFSGVAEVIQIGETVKLASDLHPEADTVAIIRQRSSYDPSYDQKLIDMIQSEDSEIEVKFFQPGQEPLIEEHLSVSRNDYVLLLSVNNDQSVYIGSKKPVEIVALGSTLPIYSCWRFLIEEGIAGGCLNSGYLQGHMAADIVSRIMDGSKPKDIGILKEGQNELMLDYRKLEQFGLYIEDLASNVKLINAPTSFYSVNKDLIIASIAALAILASIIMALIIQIINRRKAQEALQETQASLQALLNASPESAFLADPNGICLTCNTPTEKKLGKPLQMIIKRPIFENLSQTTANEMLSRFNEVIKTLKAQRYEEYEDDRRYDTTIYPVIDEFQKVTALAVFSRDITEARLAEIELKRHSEELEKANKELEQFAYVASHDLQEPLRTISSHVQLIQRRLEGQLDERARKSIGFVVEGAKRMQGLINDLLQYSRVGTRAKEPEPTDSNDSLRLALDNLEAFIKDTDAKVESDELPVVMADSAQLVQIFQNLIENGIKFRGEEQPIVSISATRRDDMWEFSVKDNGIGLDPKFEDRIFEIFQRLHGVGKYSGSGIGLAICKKIVERHGGTMWVNSEPGKGATFSFTLPGTVQGEEAHGAG
jgi:signal transduction histidine kinase/ABC-type uncharacterized transport system substrate-binding protein